MKAENPECYFGTPTRIVKAFAASRDENHTRRMTTCCPYSGNASEICDDSFKRSTPALLNPIRTGSSSFSFGGSASPKSEGATNGGNLQ